MNLFRYISFLFQVLLAAVLGTNLVSANTGHWETEIFSTYRSAVVVQVPDLAFASQTPPFDSDNIASTGAAFAQTGGVSASDELQTRAAALIFDGGFLATNTGPRLTIRDHYNHHNDMRTDVINQLEGQGYRVADGEASFGNSCGVGR